MIKIGMWEKLQASSEGELRRGTLIKFSAKLPFEENVIMMICDVPIRERTKGLITVTGYKAGINPFVAFPKEADCEAGVSRKWLQENWCKWVYEESDLNDVYIRGELGADEL